MGVTREAARANLGQARRLDPATFERLPDPETRSIIEHLRPSGLNRVACITSGEKSERFAGAFDDDAHRNRWLSGRS